MRPRADFELPPDLAPQMRRASRLEWATLVAMTAIVAAVYLTMGSSQAMKAAWVEDVLSFVAPVAFLVSARYRHRPASEEFPYGFHRSASIAFLAGSVALALFGAFILFDSTVTLVRAEHPTIGTTMVLGRPVWSGWIMMAVLFLSGIPPLVLGRMKMEPARLLHDKTLKADADMNRADWLTALAGIVGLWGIAFGWWWADAVAGAVISVSIVHDGATNLRRVVADLMDSRPYTVDGEVSNAPLRVEEALRALPWVRTAEVRLREEGHVFVGEVFLVARSTARLAEKIEEARRVAEGVDWRVHDLVVEIREVPVGEAVSEPPPARQAEGART